VNTYKYAFIVIDRLEYYITKEIEKSIYGYGDCKYVALYQRLVECIEARKELDYYPIPKDVIELLLDYGYDEEFTHKFISEYENKLEAYNSGPNSNQPI